MQNKDRAMDCPNCKYSEMRVIRSNYTSSDSVDRRRQCMRCGMRINTQEHIKPKKPKEKSYVHIS